MGNYEEAYKKYYSDAKAKLNIKSPKKEYDFKSEVMVNLDSSRDVYPKVSHSYEETNSLSKEINKFDAYEEYSNYTTRGTYSGLDNYNNQNNYSGRDGYGVRPYYGQRGRGEFNGNIKEENLLGKWGNRAIIKLAITVGLFVSVIVLKSLPYEEAKVVYTACKEVVSNDFDYKNFIEDIKTFNIIEEVDKLKVDINKEEEVDKLNEEENLNDVGTSEVENTNENIDEKIEGKVE